MPPAGPPRGAPPAQQQVLTMRGIEHLTDEEQPPWMNELLQRMGYQAQTSPSAAAGASGGSCSAGVPSAVSRRSNPAESWSGGGMLALPGLDAPRASLGPPAASSAGSESGYSAEAFRRMDLNGDGVISRSEWEIAQEFARLDTDGDGQISRAEWEAARAADATEAVAEAAAARASPRPWWFWEGEGSGASGAQSWWVWEGEGSGGSRPQDGHASEDDQYVLSPADRKQSLGAGSSASAEDGGWWYSQ